jgi:hypothetical protein
MKVKDLRPGAGQLFQYRRQSRPEVYMLNSDAVVARGGLWSAVDVDPSFGHTLVREVGHFVRGVLVMEDRGGHWAPDDREIKIVSHPEVQS